MTGILHLSGNGHMQQNSMLVFERYYSGCNFMLAIPPKNHVTERISLPENLFRWFDFSNESTYSEVLKICKDRRVDKIVLHSVFSANIKLARYLKSQFPCKVYWLFWGYELYNALGEDFGVSYVDEKFNILKRRTYFYPTKLKSYLRFLLYGTTFSKNLRLAGEVADYFCFWNKYDYELYTQYFGDKVKYKMFGYVCSERKDNNVQDVFKFPIKKKVVLINHQASVTGNHFTLMKKLKGIDTKGEFDVYMPLSYGSANMRKVCLKMGERMFGNKFKPILDYLPREEYFDIINKSQVALFGQKRQEATGNIGRLLIVGTKVFMREENPMFAYYKDKGYYIFSFEKDLNTLEDLNPLSEEQMIHNRNIWSNTKIYYDDFMPNFFNDNR